MEHNWGGNTLPSRLKTDSQGQRGAVGEVGWLGIWAHGLCEEVRALSEHG